MLTNDDRNIVIITSLALSNIENLFMMGKREQAQYLIQSEADRAFKLGKEYYKENQSNENSN